MNYFLHRRYPQIVLLVMVLIFISGCETQSPTPSTNTPITTEVEAILIAHETNVTVIRDENTESTLGKGEAIDLPLNERIKLDPAGRGKLRFNDRHEVEIFGGTEIQLDDAKMESGGSAFVRLKQIAGHIHILLDEEENARLTLETPDSTITTLEQGTEFTVCYAPEKLTCITVQEGSIEVISENKKDIYKKNDATYFKPGQPPQPAICVKEDEFNDWLARKWGPGETEALGALVTNWPQEPCAGSIAETPTEIPAEIPTEEVSHLPQPQGMVHIDAGQFEIGSTNPDEFHNAQQEITLNGYWIDAYEVTNAQYQQYLDASGQPPPAVWPGEDGYPVKGVSWGEALAYCSWLNKRLPTEAEWEVAGRGPGAPPPIFPWGDDPGAGGAVDDLPRTETYGVGAMPFNQSPFGIYDMAGNVWEWVDEPYAPIPDGHQVLRGGRHGLLRDMAYRQSSESNNERFVLYSGIRCAADQVEGE